MNQAPTNGESVTLSYVRQTAGLEAALELDAPALSNNIPTMNTLRHPDLDEREFGRQGVRTEALGTWLSDIGAVLPPTSPDVSKFDAVQLECLLTAIALGADAMTDDEAVERARAMLHDPTVAPPGDVTRRHIEAGIVAPARWLVGAEIKQQWRQRLTEAVAAGAFPIIDTLTGLPLAATGTQKRWTADEKSRLAAHYAKSRSYRVTAAAFNMSASNVRRVLNKPAGAPSVATANDPFRQVAKKSNR